MNGLVLTLCGRAGLTDAAGSPVEPPVGAKALALLAVLVLEPRPHSREALAALLWGDFPDAKARASLRQALAHLRPVLGDCLVADRETVRLAGALECDVSAFLRDADDRPADAVWIDVPRFLESLGLRHCAPFEEWATAMRQSLLGRYEGALARVGRDAVARRDWRAAIDAAERWLAANPLSEEGVRLGLEAHYLAGEHEQSLALFARYRRRLSDETGREPAPALREIVRRIETTRGARRTPPRGRRLAPTFEGSLRGRAREWERLRKAWDAARAGRATVVLIEGESGVGKTRLAGDFARWVLAEGGVVMRARAYDTGNAIPFGTLSELLHSALDAPGLAGVDPDWLAEVARVAPELRRRFPGIPSPAPSAPAEQWRLFEGVAHLLAGVADEHPAMIAIDDLQWCDADTCALLQYLVRRLESAPIVWCATMTLGAADRQSAAARLSRALRGGGHAVALSLAPLGRDDVLALVRELGRITAPDAARRFASRIHEVTGGNPYYITELLRTLFERGWLAVDPETGEWVARPDDGHGAPDDAPSPSLHEAIAQRIGGLPEELHTVLSTIAVAGRACSSAVLSHVHGISRMRAAMHGDALVDLHLASEERGEYRCAHPVIAGVVRGALTAARRREVHRAVALALEVVAGTGERAASYGDIAWNAERAGEHAMAYRYAMMASDAARRRLAHEEALAWLDLAAAAAATPDETRLVDQATAEVLSAAGRREMPRAPMRRSAAVPRLEHTDLDLRVVG